jgi:hypothetical protein
LLLKCRYYDGNLMIYLGGEDSCPSGVCKDGP